MATVQLLMQLQQTKAYSAMGCKVVSTAAESYLAQVTPAAGGVTPSDSTPRSA